MVRSLFTRSGWDGKYVAEYSAIAGWWRGECGLVLQGKVKNKIQGGGRGRPPQAFTDYFIAAVTGTGEWPPLQNPKDGLPEVWLVRVLG